MDTLWGEVVPAPEAQVTAVDDGDVVVIGGTELRVLYTPGHASHHITLYDTGRQAVFVGDVAGVRLPGSDHVRPPTPPPDIDPGLWRESLDAIRALGAKTLLLTHYGTHSGDIDRHFDELAGRLDEWIEITSRTTSSGGSKSKSWRRYAVSGTECRGAGR